jgi:16S rRNA C1402 (ribose-2'-O) methylase RsmI
MNYESSVEFLREIASDIEVSPIPGASAMTSALSAAGIASDHFSFIGFLFWQIHYAHEKPAWACQYRND